MKIQKKFLLPLAMVFSALAQSGEAAVVTSTTESDKIAQGAGQGINPLASPEAGESREAFFSSGQDLFKFVIKRSNEGQLLADHYSHQSHSSHSSHSSHRSHYSGY